MAKILIVEDDPMMARMYQNILAGVGYELELAKDGEEGLTLAKTLMPALILLDIMMPKMNGLEVLDHLKSDEQTKTIPVVILTNLSSEKDAETALSKGAVKYIIKSDFEPEKFADLIKELVKP